MAASDEPTPGQLSRLPVWARQHIEWLTRTLAEHQARIAELSAGPADSNVLVSYYGTYPDRLLGIDIPVRFLLPTARYPDGTIEVHHGRTDGVIEISSPDDALHVTPQGSNVIRVRIGEY